MHSLNLLLLRLECSGISSPILRASCQMRKIAGCACAENAGNLFSAIGVSDPGMHHDTCVTYVLWCMPGSLTSGFLWSCWRGKRSQNTRRNAQFYVSGKRSMDKDTLAPWVIWSLTTINGFLSSTRKDCVWCVISMSIKCQCNFSLLE